MYPKRLFMAERVRLPYVDLRLGKGTFWDYSRKPLKRSKWLGISCKLLKIDKRVIHIRDNRQPLEFEKSKHAFLRAIKTKKLNLCFINPFQILKRVRPVAYQIALPPSLYNLHNVFHVFQFRKYVWNSSRHRTITRASIS